MRHQDIELRVNGKFAWNANCGLIGETAMLGTLFSSAQEAITIPVLSSIFIDTGYTVDQLKTRFAAG
jgi:hypothetical protein